MAVVAHQKSHSTAFGDFQIQALTFTWYLYAQTERDESALEQTTRADTRERQGNC